MPHTSPCLSSVMIFLQRSSSGRNQAVPNCAGGIANDKARYEGPEEETAADQQRNGYRERR